MAEDNSFSRIKKLEERVDALLETVTLQKQGLTALLSATDQLKEIVKRLLKKEVSSAHI